jgi:hypothetical protein
MPAGYAIPETSRCQTEPANTNTVALIKTGFSAKPIEGELPAMADTTTAKAVEPPGGCTQRNPVIAAIATPTANAPAANPGPHNRTAKQPASAETV